MFLSGLASILCPLASSYWALVLYVVVIGILDGSYIGLMSIVTLDIVGVHKISSAWGILFFCQSFTYLLGPPAAGTSSNVKVNYLSHLQDKDGNSIVKQSLKISIELYNSDQNIFYSNLMKRSEYLIQFI